jgi:osmotically-inducible protein OsmY
MFGSRTVGGSSGLSAGNRSFTSGSGNRQTLGQGQQLGGGQGVLNRTLMNDASGGLQTNARFLRQNRSGQFVGSDAADIGAALGTLGGAQSGAGGLGGLNNLAQQLRGNNQRQRNMQPNQQGSGQNRAAQQLPFRISRRASVDLSSAAPPAATAALSAQMSRMLQRSRLVQAESPIQVVVRGRIATLRGTVASDHAREAAARLVLLEPGVDQVDNQLQVSLAAEEASEEESEE